MGGAAIIEGMATTKIDFEAGVSETVINRKSGSSNKSSWIRVLSSLGKSILEDGKGETGVFYKIGEFNNASGAKTAINSVEKRGDSLAYAVELRAVVIPDPTDPTNPKLKTSELYAAIYPSADEPAPESDDDGRDAEGYFDADQAADVVLGGS